ncbi:MAG: acyl-CoA/acyl-ACP dehydrogenase [Candidatus Syntrophoarchaeum sp.]|nr:acyl-CoA/acyl-ACP dehydrogenase [Methanomicrobia archaeon]MBL7117487.1 acyl-CoA/acyl-ACP dehydrogenase [Candidatus Syntrophoarchaeum sp.]
MKNKEEILLSADENKFRAELRDFLVREDAKKIEQEIYERDFYPREFYEKTGEEGFLAPVLPIEYGGRGKLVYEAILAEELGAACVPLAWIHSTSSYVYATIARYGSEEQKKRYLPAMKRGAKIGAIAITEPRAGSDVMRIETRAERKDGAYVISGEKRNITNGSQADVLLVWAITNPEVDPAVGMSVFIVEPGAEGFEVVEDYKLLGGFPGTVNSHLRVDAMSVPEENILGRPNEGAKIMFDELSVERALYAAMLVGEARPVLELAVGYSMEREQFGTSISRFEGISFKIADMATRLEAAKLMVYHTARLIDAGFDAEKESAMSKLLASEAFYEVAHNTVQILGGRGLSDEYPAEWAFRMARLSMIPAGTNEIMRFIVQREVYKEHKRRREGRE